MASQKIIWNRRLKARDYQAAAHYLSLVLAPTKQGRVLKAFRQAKLVKFAAKDLLRASALTLLSKEDARVDSDLRRIRKGKPLAPVLLVRGDASAAVPLTVADGYHRICAICYFDESEPVPCFLVNG